MPHDRLHDLTEALEGARYAGLRSHMPAQPSPRQHRYLGPPSGTVRDRMHVQVSVGKMVDDKPTVLLRGHLHVLVSQSYKGFGARAIGQWTHHQAPMTLLGEVCHVQEVIESSTGRLVGQQRESRDEQHVRGGHANSSLKNVLGNLPHEGLAGQLAS
jgi:hypothetical protein